MHFFHGRVVDTAYLCTYVIRLTTGQKYKTKNRPNLEAQAAKMFTQGVGCIRAKFFLKEGVKSLTCKVSFLIKTEFEILLSVYQKGLSAFRDEMNVKPFETNILRLWSIILGYRISFK